MSEYDGRRPHCWAGATVTRVDDATFNARAAERAARSELNRIEEARDVADLLSQGRDPADIARILREDPDRIARLAKLLEIRGVVAETPVEIIVRAVVLHTDRRELVERLKSILYTFGEHAPYPFEGALTGKWDDVSDAYFEGWLTREEIAEIQAAADPQPGHADAVIDTEPDEHAEVATLVIVDDEELMRDIQEGLDDLASGRTYTAEEVLEALRRRRQRPG